MNVNQKKIWLFGGFGGLRRQRLSVGGPQFSILDKVAHPRDMLDYPIDEGGRRLS